MEVIEYIEDRTLRTWTLEILDVVDDEDIHLHIEREKVCKFVLSVCRIHILDLEPVCRNIENYKFRIFLLYGNTDSLSKVSLAKSRTSEEEKRIEGSLARCC